MSSTLDLQITARLFWNGTEIGEVWRDGVRLWEKPVAASPLVLDAVEINLDAAQCPISGGTVADLTGAHVFTARPEAARSEVSAGSGTRWVYDLNGDGASTLVETATIPPALTGLSAVTAEVWANPSSRNVDHGFFGSQEPDAGEGPFDLRMDKGGYLGGKSEVIKFSAGSVDLETSANSTSTGWQHLAAVYDAVAGVVKVYKNGVDLGSSATTGNFSSGISCSKFILGQAGKNHRDDAFDGSIAVLRVHRRALSLAEILQNYNAQAGEFGLS